MVPVGLSEAIIQQVSALRASDGGSQILVMACMCLSSLYLPMLALIQFGFGINMPTLFILEGEAHPALMLLINEYALMGFGEAIMYSHVIIVAGTLRGLLDVMAIMIAAVLCYWVGWHRADVGLCRDHWAWQPTCIDRSVIVRDAGGAPHFLAVAPQLKKISMKQDTPQVKAVWWNTLSR